VILAVLLFFVVINNVRTSAQLRGISLIFLLGGGLTGFLAILFYIIPETWTIRLLSLLRVIGYPNEGILRYIEDNPDNPMRAIATSIDPNALGGLLIILTIIGVAYLFARQPIMLRRYLIVNVGLMGLALYLTFSRGSLLGVVAALGLMSLLRYRKLLVYMIGLALLMLILPQTQLYVTRFLEGVQGSDLATQMRFGEYKDAMLLITRYPILGVGFAGTPDIDLYVGVSSLYFLIAEQMGLVGMSLFMLISLVFFGLAFQSWRKMPAGHRLEAPLLGYSLAVFGAMVGGIFDHFFFNIQFTHLVALYWLIMGLGVATVLIYHREAGL
jgi:O-antigen ligase